MLWVLVQCPQTAGSLSWSSPAVSIILALAWNFPLFFFWWVLWRGWVQYIIFHLKTLNHLFTSFITSLLIFTFIYWLSLSLTLYFIEIQTLIHWHNCTFLHYKFMHILIRTATSCNLLPCIALFSTLSLLVRCFLHHCLVCGLVFQL